MDKETGETLKDENDDEITRELTFTAEAESETQTLTFEINDEDAVKAKEIVVFEELYGPDEDVTGEMVLRASHKDLNDANQTVVYPTITTEAFDFNADVDIHEGVAAYEFIDIYDFVNFNKFIEGKTYTIKMSLYDKDTGDPIIDTTGESASCEYTHEYSQSDKTAVMCPINAINYSDVKGKDVVVFEEIYFDGILIASHKDLNDTDQTVSYPEISTSAVDDTTGTKEGYLDDDTVQITDTVSYKKLCIGDEYEVVGTLMDKSTKKAITDADGNAITGSTIFTPTEREGEVEVHFTCDSTLVEGKDVVVFETLNNISSSFDDVAHHQDITDKNQTITYSNPGSLKIIKYGSNDNILQGVSLQLSDEDGNVLRTATTDKNGEVSFKNLKKGTYYLIETKTLDGLSLLADPIKVEIPKVVSMQEAEDMGIDENTDGVTLIQEGYQLWKQTYEIRNTEVFFMPQTGSDGTWNVGLIALSVLTCTVMFVYLKSKKRNNI